MSMGLREELSTEETVGFFREKTDFPKDYVPSEDEPYMNPRQLAYFRRKLLSWREELEEQSTDFGIRSSNVPKTGTHSS